MSAIVEVAVNGVGLELREEMPQFLGPNAWKTKLANSGRIDHARVIRQFMEARHSRRVPASFFDLSRLQLQSREECIHQG
jgi:hypothetical protein